VNSTGYNFRINGSLRAQITEGLDFTLMYENAKRFNLSKNISDENAYSVNMMINNAAQVAANGNITYNIPLGAQIRERRASTSGYTLRGQLNFNRTLKNVHSINAIMGGERHKSFSEGTNVFRLGYNHQTLTWSLINASTLANRITGTQSLTNDFVLSNYLGSNNFTENDDRFASFYGNAAYTYNNKYTATGSLRWDGSNLFGAKYRAVPLWSVGLSWNMSNEPFINIRELTLLRLRTTYGINGNVPRGSSGSYMVVQVGYNPRLGTEFHRIVNPPNDGLTWERTSTLNIGVDFAFFGNRISVNWDYYNRNTDNMLGEVMADPTFGWSTVQRNYGRMRNHGTELSLNTVNVRSRNGLEWQTNFVVSYNKNKLVESYVSNPSIFSYLRGSDMEGYPLRPVFNFRYAGLSASGDPLAYDLDGNKVSNVDDFNALVFGGTLRPTYNGGISNSIAYRGVTLSFMIIFNGGHVTRKDQVPYIMNDFGALFGNIHKDIANRWQQPGDENKPNVTPAVRLENNMYGGQVWGSRDIDIIRADYACLRNVTLFYDIPSKLTNRAGINSARVYVQAQNVAIWAANKDNLFPEGALGARGVLGLKRTPTWMLGLNINL
jgi:hypothetical protein